MNAKTAIQKVGTAAAWLSGPTPEATMARRAILMASSASLPWLVPALTKVTGTSDPLAAIGVATATLAAMAGVVGTIGHTRQRVKKQAAQTAEVAVIMERVDARMQATPEAPKVVP